jgi:hypothetical protein
MPCRDQSGRFQVRILRTFAELEEVREFWASMQTDPESDPDFVSFIIRSRPEILRPYVIVLYKNGSPVSLLVGRVEKSHLEIKIGYKVIWRVNVRRIAIFYGGFMGQTDVEAGEQVIRQLLRSLLLEKAALLVWSGVPQASDLQRLLRHVPNVFCRDYLARQVQRWKMTMPVSLDELLEKRMNKKHRYWVKRTMRLLEKDFPGAIRFVCYSTPEEMDKLFTDVIKVASKTYQWALGVGFRDNDEQRKRLLLEAEHGWLRGHVVYVKDEPAAFWICTVYRDTVFSDYTGYDPKYKKYEIGTVLFMRMIGEMCREQVKQLDFGPGTALYKERFGDAQFREATYCVFACNWIGISLNVMRLLVESPLELCRTLLKRLGLEQTIKKIWRRQVVPVPEKNIPVQTQVSIAADKLGEALND